MMDLDGAFNAAVEAVVDACVKARTEIEPDDPAVEMAAGRAVKRYCIAALQALAMDKSPGKLESVAAIALDYHEKFAKHYSRKVLENAIKRNRLAG